MPHHFNNNSIINSTRLEQCAELNGDLAGHRVVARAVQQQHPRQQLPAHDPHCPSAGLTLSLAEDAAGGCNGSSQWDAPHFSSRCRYNHLQELITPKSAGWRKSVKMLCHVKLASAPQRGVAVLEGVQRRQRLERRLPFHRHDASEDALVQPPATLRLLFVSHDAATEVTALLRVMLRPTCFYAAPCDVAGAIVSRNAAI